MDHCVQTGWLSNQAYLRQFSQKAIQQRIPLHGSLELTPRCTLRCLHCYLGSQEEHHRQQALEMDTAQVCSILDQVTRAGCLYLLITGGDPLLRRDFPEIYRHARQNGLLVTVFTNGVLVTDQIVELFQEFPPRLVEITLYGATAATYERITGVKGSFERCLAGIRRLQARNIRLGLKTMLLTANRHEFEAIKNMAIQEFGTRFRFDAVVHACFNGDSRPVSLRVTPEEAIEKEFSDPDQYRKWQNFLDTFQQAGPSSDSLYQCGAGLATFHIDAYGHLQPCLMATGYQYNLLEGDFLTGWRELMPRLRQKKASPAYVCHQCDKRLLCSLCPPLAQLECGSEEGRPEYMCLLAGHRTQILKNGRVE